MVTKTILALLVLSFLSCENPSDPLPLTSPDGRMPIITGLRITAERDPTEIDVWGTPNDMGIPASIPEVVTNKSDQPETVTPGVVPRTVSLEVPFPNPSNISVSIIFSIPIKMNTQIWIVPADLPTRLFSLSHQFQGYSIRELLHNSELQAGYYLFQWDGKDDSGKPVPAGLYRIYCKSGETLLWRDLLFLTDDESIVTQVRNALD